MLGCRKSQTSFFDAIRLPHPVSPDSFYGRMGSLSGQMFRDEDLAEFIDRAKERISTRSSQF